MHACVECTLDETQHLYPLAPSCVQSSNHPRSSRRLPQTIALARIRLPQAYRACDISLLDPLREQCDATDLPSSLPLA